jgi:hypothetical protein
MGAGAAEKWSGGAACGGARHWHQGETARKPEVAEKLLEVISKVDNSELVNQLKAKEVALKDAVARAKEAQESYENLCRNTGFFDCGSSPCTASVRPIARCQEESC